MIWEERDSEVEDIKLVARSIAAQKTEQVGRNTHNHVLNGAQSNPSLHYSISWKRYSGDLPLSFTGILSIFTDKLHRFEVHP